MVLTNFNGINITTIMVLTAAFYFQLAVVNQTTNTLLWSFETHVTHGIYNARKRTAKVIKRIQNPTNHQSNRTIGIIHKVLTTTDTNWKERLTK
jgi:hypothetical protein